MSWPDGYGQAMHMDCRGRDIATSADGEFASVISYDELRATIGPDRSITSIAALPVRPGIEQMIGARGGSGLRQVLDKVLPQEGAAATPLYLLIDDLSGASLIGGWVWSRWMRDWMPKSVSPADPEEAIAFRLRNFGDVCVGLAQGTVGIADIRGHLQNCQEVAPLPRPDDPVGWHEMSETTAPSMRRARRIDVWRDGERIYIDAMFQDSGTLPGGGRAAVHEYTLELQADSRTLAIEAIRPVPRVLPYPDCPGAVANAQRLVGQRLPALRGLVPELLARTAGCTHLNDALRALTDVPLLLDKLPESNGSVTPWER